MTINDIKALDDLMELWEEGHTDKAESTPREYKPKSQVFPALQGNPNIWAFTQPVTNEICQTKWRKTSQSNLTPAQQEAVLSLQQDHCIIIKPSDKGGNLIVMECNQYETMVMNLLKNQEWYKKYLRTMPYRFTIQKTNRFCIL